MKRTVSLIIAVLVLTLSFAAVSDSSLSDLQSKGIVEGFDDGELHPEIILTRAQFAKIMVNSFPDAVSTEVFYRFSDLDSGHWAFEYIQKAVNSGWLKGFPDETFRPDDAITFEQAVTVVCRALDIDGYYYDYPDDYISEGIEHSITDGVNAVIGEAINRENAAKIIVNALNYEQYEKNERDLESKYVSSYSGYAAGGAKAPSYYTKSDALTESGAVETEELVGRAFEDVYPHTPFNTEDYSPVEENVFKDVATSPLSTFSIDTDTASYSNLRRFILNGQHIPEGSVRTEELINYFDYAKAEIEEGKPFGVKYAVAQCPWNSENLLAMITVSGEELIQPKPSNIVFLIDVSGSMYSYNKLPLVKQSLSLMLNKLNPDDTVSIVTYASGTRVALEPTPVSEKEKIIATMYGLYASGGTYGEGGIELSYELAEKNKIDGNNRIILCTDGDFNIGASSDSEIERLISEKRKTGIFLSVLGFGMGNYKDNKMEILADKGNGNYAYIDTLKEAKKVLVDEVPKTIYTIAKDVKLQTEFNPNTVSKYRLIGYENRVMNNEDFENDNKDAGELGAGATVTVLYELVPSNGQTEQKLKYQKAETTESSELMTVKIRYKLPDEDESILAEYPVLPLISALDENFSFAAAVAELGMILNDSDYKGSSDLDSVIALAREGVGDDTFGIRSEFIQLVDLLRYRKLK